MQLSGLHILYIGRNNLISRIPFVLRLFLLIALQHHHLLNHIVKDKVIASYECREPKKSEGYDKYQGIDVLFSEVKRVSSNMVGDEASAS